MLKVKEVMTKKVVAVTSQTKVTKAANLLWKKNLSGMPVINRQRQVVGIVTEYDLIAKEQKIHIPSFIKVLKSLKYYGQSKAAGRQIFERLAKLTVGDVMTKDPFCVSPETSLQDVAKIFSYKKI